MPAKKIKPLMFSDMKIGDTVLRTAPAQATKDRSFLTGNYIVAEKTITTITLRGDLKSSYELDAATYDDGAWVVKTKVGKSWPEIPRFRIKPMPESEAFIDEIFVSEERADEILAAMTEAGESDDIPDRAAMILYVIEKCKIDLTNPQEIFVIGFYAGEMSCQ